MKSTVDELNALYEEAGGAGSVWIGHYLPLGWLLLDRNRPANSTGHIAGGRVPLALQFERFADWSEVELDRASWTEMHFYKQVPLDTETAKYLLDGFREWNSMHQLRQRARSQRAKQQKVDGVAATEAAERAQQQLRFSQLPQNEWDRVDWVNWLRDSLQSRLENETDAIRAFVAERNIKYLVHFTSAKNVKSILTNGLQPRHALERKELPFVFNDDARFDGITEASCLSVEFPNYQMLFKYRQASPDLCVLAFDACLLLETRCIFTPTNAAHELHRKHIRSFGAYAGITALARLFDGGTWDRIKYSLPAAYTTDPQAEVMALDAIPPRFIKGIAFNRGIPEAQRQELLKSPLGGNCLAFPDLSVTHRHWLLKRKDDARRYQTLTPDDYEPLPF